MISRAANVHFTPGSAALHILDHQTQQIRKPDTADYVRYVQLLTGLGHIAAQSTAFIPADVADRVSDSYRLFLSLLYGEKPVVTGTFTIESFRVMRDMQLAVRGGEKELRDKPLAIFSCCPTSPLKWSEITSQNVVDCAAAGIPVEFISMPLSGFMAPVTLVGTLVQHTAETLSGIVISQVARPGAPVLYGGSPAVFDMRYETTPMGAVETQMVDCAYNEIGKHLGLPTQAYISLSDAKLLDAQAGLETAMGATLAALSGINSISGPGMLDFESCQSLEKLVLDNEICGMTLRLVRGIEPREDFPARPIFEELLRDGHLLISPHTRRHLQDEHYFPGPVIDRANLSRWREDGSLTLGAESPPGSAAAGRRLAPDAPGRRAQKGIVRPDGKRGAALGHGPAPGPPGRSMIDFPLARLLPRPAAVYAALGLKSGRQPSPRSSALLQRALAMFAAGSEPQGLSRHGRGGRVRRHLPWPGSERALHAAGKNIPPRRAACIFSPSPSGKRISAEIRRLFAGEDFALGSVLDAVASWRPTKAAASPRRGRSARRSGGRGRRGAQGLFIQPRLLRLAYQRPGEAVRRPAAGADRHAPERKLPDDAVEIHFRRAGGRRRPHPPRSLRTIHSAPSARARPAGKEAMDRSA